MSPTSFQTLDPVSRKLKQGELVTYEEAPGEFFTIDLLEGEYRSSNGRFFYRVWLRPIDVLAHIPFPARLDQLKPVTKH